MEKAQKVKSSFLATIQKLSSELHKKSVKTKHARHTPARNLKGVNSTSMLSVQKSTLKKKTKDSVKAPVNAHPHSNINLENLKQLKKVPYKGKRNHSLEGNYNEESTNAKKPKRNNSLVEIEKEKEIWDMSKLPYAPAKVLKSFSKSLSFFEQNEILQYRSIFYIAKGIQKLEANPKRVNNGFDDERNDYILIKNDHIQYRYEILEILGRGSYGQVIKAYDHKEKTLIAIKIIRNLSCIIHQAKIEIQLLYKLLQPDEGSQYVINILEHFIYRNHICLTFSLLSINLYQYQKLRTNNPLPSSTVKSFTEQILKGIKFYQGLEILHCDLKPENIMLNEDKTLVKIIDFGSGCFSNKRVFTYIQSRFYRAPEVILEIGYDEKIDIWSLGCVVAEMIIGKPLFSGKDEIDQLICFVEVLGFPPAAMIEESPKRSEVLDAIKKNPSFASHKFRGSGGKGIKSVLGNAEPAVVEFVQSKIYAECLMWDPCKRFSAEEALGNAWFCKTPMLQHVMSLPVLKTDKLNSSSSKKTVIEDNSPNKISKKRSFIY